MSKENAEKFLALYQQHKAIAEALAELDKTSDRSMVDGLVKLAKELKLECTSEELEQEIRKQKSEQSDSQMEDLENLGSVAGGGTGEWWGCTVFLIKMNCQ